MVDYSCCSRCLSDECTPELAMEKRITGVCDARSPMLKVKKQKLEHTQCGRVTDGAIMKMMMCDVICGVYQEVGYLTLCRRAGLNHLEIWTYGGVHDFHELTRCQKCKFYKGEYPR